VGDVARLEITGKIYELPIVTGMENESAVDISALRGTSGLITLDSGYKNTGSCQSAVTFLDGEKVTPPSPMSLHGLVLGDQVNLS
jgi:citrate synthase